MIHTTFILEQHLGHQTYAQNLRRFISQDRRMETQWVGINYAQTGGLWEHIPLLPGKLRGAGRGFQQVRASLRPSQASKPQALFFNTQAPAVFALDWLNRFPCVISTDITPIQYDLIGSAYGHQADRLPLMRLVKGQINRMVFQRAAHVVAWSNWVRQSLLNDYGLAEDRVSLVPPGVDLELWSPAAPRIDRPRPDAVQILFVGGDFKRKGGPVLLEAFQHIPAGQAELHLVTREPIAPTAGVHVHHNLQPNSPSLRELYRKSNLFVLPSLAEAFGLAAVEALACGLPCIVSKTGGLAEIIRHGKTGLVVRPGNVQDLADALAALIANPQRRAEMGQAARLDADQRFDARRNASRIVDLILASVTRVTRPASSNSSRKKQAEPRTQP